MLTQPKDWSKTEARTSGKHEDEGGGGSNGIEVVRRYLLRESHFALDDKESKQYGVFTLVVELLLVIHTISNSVESTRREYYLFVFPLVHVLWLIYSGCQRHAWSNTSSSS